MRKKAIYFYQYLPPWRIDVFNEIAKYYDLTIVFFNSENEGFTYDREELLKKLINIKVCFFNKGFKIGSRPFRFGIRKLLRINQPDVVFVHEYSSVSIVLSLYKKLHIFNYNLYVTTSDNLAMAKNAKGLKCIIRSFVLDAAEGLIVYSNAVCQWYRNKFPHLKIEICPNIQKPETLLDYRDKFQTVIAQYKNRYHLNDSSIILYAGRLVSVKGIDLLLNAFAKSNSENYKLVIVGDGNNREQLQNQTKEMGITEDVIFVGYCSGLNLYAWYDMANFFILPSRYEPFGAVVNESLIYGLPVVASKYIGALDFINENNGIIVDPLNEDEFTQTLNKAMTKYRQKIKINRENLMEVSFYDYVKSFKIIDEN